MKVNVRHAKNGIILTIDDTEMVYQGPEDESTEQERWADFLRELTDQFGPMQDAFSDQCVWVLVAPGDEWDGDIKCPLQDTMVCPVGYEFVDFSEPACSDSGYVCTRCKTIVIPDPYNPNYYKCDCPEIGQVDPTESFPESWKKAEVRAYIKDVS